MVCAESKGQLLSIIRLTTGATRLPSDDAIDRLANAGTCRQGPKHEERTRLSLRTRLLFSMFLTLLLSLAAGAAFTYWRAVAKIETEMQAAVVLGGPGSIW